MARKYTPTSLKDLVRYHINLYYIMLLENPGIRTDHKKHFNEVEIVERHWLKALSETQWENEENELMFKARLDFLTGVYSKEKELKELSNMKRQLLERVR